MALSTVTLTNQFTTEDQKSIVVFGTAAVSASPGTYATGGLTVNLNSLGVPVNSVPVIAYFASAAPAATPNTTQYSYQFAPGTTLANGKLQVFTGGGASTPSAELAAAATPAGVSGDTIKFEIRFKKGGV
jgi:hypothetical protein